MKRIGITVFAFVLWMSLVAIAQDTGAQQPAGSSQGTMTSSKKEGAKLQHLKGKISADGKSITIDKGDKTYTIENSDAVKGHEGHDVRLSGHVDAAANSIRVTSVKMAGEKASKDKTGAMSEQPPE
jgi:hypothetical protein